ncbi:RagB/SusD family nutrient uptake outer membrane protein [Myroides marinus]|uniref:RagB/SusD family nutrient uptake outer membrane protein n=1 Tax=Myroides marinus TaxID=703342 RepID=UPI002575247B|nr:RagB/SusD family nutrient uptake outer membrane protein [Myroides marinus]MDM1346193.1 RagB/SusD family nutrient uptake outer membrane protein [Myroides marinus]MDM1349547.1 RagB/SusD family nutrient uptake outer membrane protein [Myroides marinus]MDM1353791.1 RagB/SusD family nutrient uptake outer membrane protein [Myroides marinus]MDM1356757.1 RagB/SusD family nutrient uptake outer membrane protein [Myroides marinus]MDM1361114.1 RagB/SusD family nutrient uptake outer membrane protein [Myr
MKKNILIALLAISLASCSKEYLDKDQESTFSDSKMEQLKTTPELALKLYTAIEGGNYSYMVDFQSGGVTNHRDFGIKGFDIGLDLMSGDMAEVLSTNMWNPYETYRGRLENGDISYALWYFHTRVANAMNTVIIGSTGSNDEKLIQIEARARAIRAYVNFTLIRLFANGEEGIPYADKDVFYNGRQSTSDVLKFIETDLLYAFENLNGYVRPTKNYVNANVVAGFLSRFYLYKEDYSNALKYSDLAFTNANAVSFSTINNGFDLIDNPDWLWGFDIDGSTSTSFASFFSWMDNVNTEGYGGPNKGLLAVDAGLYSKIDAGDLRKKWFVSKDNNPHGLRNYVNMKFIDRSGSMLGDYSYMRETEIYFNKAEALYHLGDTKGALDILKKIMITRNPNYAFSNTDKSLLEEIKLQKRIEFWGEGLAFYDAKRWKRDILRSYEGSNHLSATYFNIPAGSNLLIFQFPIQEMRANKDLTKQNPAQ